MTAPTPVGGDVRSEFVTGTDACREAVLTPENDLGLDPALRRALAARMCLAIGMPDMAADYAAPLHDPLMQDIARGAGGTDHAVAAIVRQADLITLTPKQATAADLGTLQDAGLSVPQIVALSELIAFVNYETRVRKGLDLLEALA